MMLKTRLKVELKVECEMPRCRTTFFHWITSFIVEFLIASLSFEQCFEREIFRFFQPAFNSSKVCALVKTCQAPCFCQKSIQFHSYHPLKFKVSCHIIPFSLSFSFPHLPFLCALSTPCKQCQPFNHFNYFYLPSFLLLLLPNIPLYYPL